MSELMFPGGLVRIDETEVWRKLSRWLGEGTERAVHAWQSEDDGKLQARLLCHDSGDEFIGSSALGLADAIAQALQCAYVRQEQVL